MDIQEIRAHLTELSGSGKRIVTTRKHGLYSSITIPGLDDMQAVRDTKQRFADFYIPESLEGKTFLDLGSNVGAMAFEAIRRGASVTGVEYRDDRVALCNAISQMFDFKARFWQADFNEGPFWATKFEAHDIVLCSSVDEYINDIPDFYSKMRMLCKETLYFECNVQRNQDVNKTIEFLTNAGFHNVLFLGSGHSGGISRKRKIYRATVAPPAAPGAAAAGA